MFTILPQLTSASDSVFAFAQYLNSTNFRQQIINPFMYSVWAGSEALRLYMGWVGNLQEEVRYLFGYLVLTIMPQVITVFYSVQLVRPLLPVSLLSSACLFCFVFVLICCVADRFDYVGL
jgi:hypothetical protein